LIHQNRLQFQTWRSNKVKTTKILIWKNAIQYELQKKKILNNDIGIDHNEVNIEPIIKIERETGEEIDFNGCFQEIDYGDIEIDLNEDYIEPIFEKEEKEDLFGDNEIDLNEDFLEPIINKEEIGFQIEDEKNKKRKISNPEYPKPKRLKSNKDNFHLIANLRPNDL